MKTVTLKVYQHTVKLPDGTDRKAVLTTLSILKTSVEKVPREGWGVQEMRRSMKLLGLLEKYDKNFPFEGFETETEKMPKNYLTRTIKAEFEDADYDAIAKSLEGGKWTVLSEGITETYDAFGVEK